MEVGDLLYFTPFYYNPDGSVTPLKSLPIKSLEIGIVVEVEESSMKVFWFKDGYFSKEGLPGTPYFDDERIGLLKNLIQDKTKENT